MKKKIIITGALGYIGTELCKLYSGESWDREIVAIDNRFISERVSQLNDWGIKFIQGDILDKKFISEFWSASRFKFFKKIKIKKERYNKKYAL